MLAWRWVSAHRPLDWDSKWPYSRCELLNSDWFVVLASFVCFYIFLVYFFTHFPPEFYLRHITFKPLIHLLLFIIMCLQTSANSDFVNAPTEKVSVWSLVTIYSKSAYMVHGRHANATHSYIPFHSPLSVSLPSLP
jgi:hypothetical protein